MTTAYRITKIAQRNATLIAKLPEPPDTFRKRDIDGLSRDDVMRLHAKECIVVEDAYSGEVNEWSVDPVAYEAAVRYLDRVEVFGCCGSTGFMNGGDGLYCSDCGEELTREEVERVMG